MFLETRKIGNRTKFYLVHSYRVGKRIKRISCYLGSDLGEAELSAVREKAERYIVEQLKERNILEFELTPAEIQEFKKYDQKIKIHHLHPQAWEKFIEEFTYNTNAIEGSTVPRTDVRALLHQRIPPKSTDEQESINVSRAVTYIQKSKEKLTTIFIKKIHLLCFQGTKNFAGALRKVEVVIKDGRGNIIHQGAPAQKVEALLSTLCRWYEQHRMKYPPLLLAAVVHNEFEKIHPFQDGNGRVGRLLLNYILLRHGYPPLNVRLHDRGRYYWCLQVYDHQHDIKPTLKFLIQQYQKGRVSTQ
ncbi:Fic family protein [Candidatus Woesearchaeota archaeon]|nr:Fic family protein [Candidatus Woesearchaeota archaeon]